MYRFYLEIGRGQAAMKEFSNVEKKQGQTKYNKFFLSLVLARA